MPDIGRSILIGVMNRLAGWFADLSELFWDFATWVGGYPILMPLMPYFWDIAQFFGDISWDLTTLRNSLLIIYDRTLEILNWDTIWSLILANLPDISVIADWIANAFWYITGLINTWWDSTRTAVQSWIEIARQEVMDLINQVSSSLGSLQSAWDFFVTSVLPNILMPWEIDELIKSWFQSYEPFWAGWQEVYSAFRDFFDDPEAWLYGRIENMLERFW